MSGFAAGVVLGMAVTYAATRVTTQRRQDHSTVPELTDEDRQAVAAEFANHREAVQRQVSEYADNLAGGDSALRELLAAIERGRASLRPREAGGR